VICDIIRGESDDLITNSLQLTQNSKSYKKKNGTQNFDSATLFYDHRNTSQNGLRPHSSPRTSIFRTTYYAVAKCHFESSELKKLFSGYTNK
jgi:hypothetical protein